MDASVETEREAMGLALNRFVWSASGRHLFFEGRAQESIGLWRITVDPKTLAWTGGPDRLTTGTTQDTHSAIAPDGRRIIFSAQSAKTRLWMFPFDAATGRRHRQPASLSPPARAGELDADAPDDGSKLVFRTTRGSEAAGVGAYGRRRAGAAARRGR